MPVVQAAPVLEGSQASEEGWMRRLLTAKQVADRLQISLSTVYLWVDQGVLPCIALSRGTRKRCLRFDEEALEHWLEERIEKSCVDRLPLRK